MSNRRVLTIFGATGLQGGSVIRTILSHPTLRSKYTLRAVTRDPSSASALALAEQGVQIVTADANAPATLRAALQGSYGVFAVTNFWAPDVLDKSREIAQGRNMFDAARAEGVSHFVWSALPHVERLTEGKLTRVVHFDGKAEVRDYIEENKGEMIASYFMPAGYIGSYTGQIHDVDGVQTMIMPFEFKDMDTPAWSVLDAGADTGKYVAGLFEGGAETNGAAVQGVSYWTSPREFLAAAGKSRGGADVAFMSISPEDYAAKLPPFIAQELTETMRLIGEWSYYGPGSAERQAESDKWLIDGDKRVTVDHV